MHIINLLHCFEQVSVPEDYRLWHETMLTEFPSRFQRLFAGPMWSGSAKEDIRVPIKVIVFLVLYLLYSLLVTCMFPIVITQILTSCSYKSPHKVIPLEVFRISSFAHAYH